MAYGSELYHKNTNEDTNEDTDEKSDGIILTIFEYFFASCVIGAIVYSVVEYSHLILYPVFTWFIFQIKTNTSFVVALGIALTFFLFGLNLRYRLLHRIIAYFKDQAYLQQLARHHGLIPLAVDINGVVYVANWTGISYKYMATFKNNTWHSLPQPLTYQDLVDQYGPDAIKAVKPITFVGGR